MKPTKRLILSALFATLLLPSLGLATEKPDEVTEQAAITERLNQKIDLSLQFKNQHGEQKTLGDLLAKNRPTILVPVYFGCPRLCGLTQSALVKSINGLDFILGEDYRVLSLSFDETETVQEAKEKALSYYPQIKGLQQATTSWDFLVGDKGNIDKLMSEIGFSFEEDRGEYIHQALLVVLTPDGRISRYFYGINYPVKDLRFALVEAAKGKIGNTLDMIKQYCFRFDPTKGKYSLAIWNLTRVFCSLIFILLVFVVGYLLWQEKLNVKKTI